MTTDRWRLCSQPQWFREDEGDDDNDDDEDDDGDDEDDNNGVDVNACPRCVNPKAPKET